jgi:ubiquinone/menaquinone biosynthesis C-methylase UbiE
MSHTTFSQKDWENYARCYDGLNKLSPYRSMLNEVTKRISVKTGERILEAACGTGNLTELLCGVASKDNGNSPEIFAVDYSDAMLERAMQKCGTGAHFLKADLNQALHYEDGFFHSIVCVNTLYALKEPEAMLREFTRLLIPEGQLVLVTPKKGFENGLILKAHKQSSHPDAYWKHVHESPDREEMLIREAIDDEETIGQMLWIAKHNRSIAREEYFHFYTENDLRILLESAGLRITEMLPVYAAQSILVVTKKSSTHKED